MRKLICLGIAISIMSSEAHADCAADLQAVVEKLLKAGPYHTDMSMVAGGRTTDISSDVILPDRFHMTMPQGEVVKIKDGLWMKVSGKWQAMPASVAHAIQSPIDQGIAQGMKNVKNLNCLGPQDYDGQSFTTYEFDSSGEAAGIKSKAHVIMYVDAASGLPAWMIVNGEAMGRKSTMTQHVTFDPGITITQPK
jgi:hypothetical protein